MSPPNPRLTVPPGTVLFSPGQVCSGYVVVHSGTVRVGHTAENGREIILYRVRPGDLCLQTFICLVSHQPYAAEGTAETAVELEVIPAAAFDRKVAADPDFRAQLFRAVAARFADMEQLVEDVALTGLAARIARGLLRLQDSAGTITATHEVLAAEIGSGRAADRRGLAALARAGVIELGRGHVQVRDPVRLAGFAHEPD